MPRRNRDSTIRRKHRSSRRNEGFPGRINRGGESRIKINLSGRRWSERQLGNPLLAVYRRRGYRAAICRIKPPNVANVPVANNAQKRGARHSAPTGDPPIRNFTRRVTGIREFRGIIIAPRANRGGWRGYRSREATKFPSTIFEVEEGKKEADERRWLKAHHRRLLC